MKKLHHSFPFLLLLLCVVPLLTPVYVLIATSVIHSKMSKTLETASLQTYTFSADKVIWITEGKELLFEGRYYDVKEYSESNNCVIITGLCDDDESNIQHQINAVNNSPDNENDPFTLCAIKGFLTPATLTSTHTEFAHTEKSSVFLFRSYTENAVSRCFDISLPPPRGLLLS